MDQIIFLTKAETPAEKLAARLLIDSLRTFGGEIGRSPVWVFNQQPYDPASRLLETYGVEVIPLVVPPHLQTYLYGDKVYACARAEQLAPAGVHSLVWIDASCLVVNPPVLYDLGGALDAAFRPVHIRNIGLPAGDPVDPYWQKVYAAFGVTDIAPTVESFADRQLLRAYFNTHSFVVDPAKGLLCRWLAEFEKLVADSEFQAGACQGKLHKIFLHQAVLSALIVTSLDWPRLRILPPDYNYPYHLHSSLAPDLKAQALNDLVTFTLEEDWVDPATITGVEIREPLRFWWAGYRPG